MELKGYSDRFLLLFLALNPSVLLTHEIFAQKAGFHLELSHKQVS